MSFSLESQAATSCAPQFLLIDVKRNQKHLFGFSARYQGRIDSHPAQDFLLGDN
ncbi:hypothetical protein Vspart_03508 [Vibrio spartinae]|uniref:Uncharacterized protein n=1 Tax=Vibrio spartinae TaxID=1918945 RepID=A0A1N6M227_9VIBR|nr:hypothetical protein Vspart_03508 [Vibrio spartinae]SIO93451.1 hypothetical protein VSP9026_01118 [Vibrio spartinae]